jgi:hypothetical protein
MAITMGAVNRYPAFTTYDQNSFKRGDLDFYIRERQVVEDKLTKQERIQALQAMDGTERIILQELEVPEGEINLIVDQVDDRARAEARGFAQGVFGDAIVPPDADEESDDIESE